MMTKAEIKATAEAVKEYQMKRNLEALGDSDRVGVDLPSDFKVDPDVDEFWAEDLMQDAKDFMKEPSEYGEEVRLLGYRIETLKSAASSARAIRYDRERVQGGMPYGMADMVLDLIDMESEFDNVRCWYKIINNDVKKLLYKALDKQSADIWYECYVKGYSRSAVAFRHGITKRQVQWLLEKKQNIVSVLIAFNNWREGVEYYED